MALLAFEKPPVFAIFFALQGHAGQPVPRAENRERGLKGTSVKSLTESHFVL